MPAGELRPLFVTRKFPPSVGGMQTLAEGVWRALSGRFPQARLLAHGGANRALVWWLPWALLRTAALVLARRVDVVVTGDALTFAVLAPLLRLTGTPGSTMVMGLDLTYPRRGYQWALRRSLPLARQVVAISAATAEVATTLVPPERVRVVPLGVSAPQVTTAERAGAAAELRRRLDLGADTVVLLTLGRLVRRKGGRWFVGQVLPGLPPDCVYLLAGDGPERPQIQAAAEQAGVAARVRLLGPVDDATRELLLRGADLFVQPNVAVPGDMEGFGLVVIEAVLRGTPVVAAALEGILDAVVPDQTGVLLAPGDAPGWTTSLAGLLADREALAETGRRMAEQARDRYGHERMARELLAALELSARER